jgi:hypothetical protein
MHVAAVGSFILIWGMPVRIKNLAHKHDPGLQFHNHLRLQKVPLGLLWKRILESVCVP